MSRTKEEILIEILDSDIMDFATVNEDLQLALTLNPSLEKVKEAMDENGKQMCLALLEYMAKERIICSHDENGPYFLVRGETLSKDQIFENFL